MPRGDGTGPTRKGAQTGRGLGKAKGNSSGQGIGQPRMKFSRKNSENNRPNQTSGRRKVNF